MLIRPVWRPSDVTASINPWTYFIHCDSFSASGTVCRMEMVVSFSCGIKVTRRKARNSYQSSYQQSHQPCQIGRNNQFMNWWPIWIRNKGMASRNASYMCSPIIRLARPRHLANHSVGIFMQRIDKAFRHNEEHRVICNASRTIHRTKFEQALFHCTTYPKCAITIWPTTTLKGIRLPNLSGTTIFHW